MFITRDKTELEDAPFITLRVYCFSGDKTTVRGFHMFNYQEAGREVLRGSTFLCLPVEQAFDKARRYAESTSISAIWIDDPDRLFAMVGM